MSLLEKIIDKANEVAKTNYEHDEDNPIASLSEALAVFTCEFIDDEESAEIYDLINDAINFRG